MRVKDIRIGDIITYRDGRINYVNKPVNYMTWYDKNFTNKKQDCKDDIVKIQRYVKCLWLYRLKTMYERVD